MSIPGSGSGSGNGSRNGTPRAKHPFIGQHNANAKAADDRVAEATVVVDAALDVFQQKDHHQQQQQHHHQAQAQPQQQEELQADTSTKLQKLDQLLDVFEEPFSTKTHPSHKTEQDQPEM